MPKSKIQDIKLLELYHEGLTNREIAERLDVSQAAVHYRMEKLGLINNCRKIPSLDVEQMKILHGMGLTNIGIAHFLKVSVSAITNHMKKAGLEDNYYQLKRLFA